MKETSRSARRILGACLLFITYYLLLITPVSAFNIGDKFGFGDIKSLGQAINLLVMPVFSIAATLVILYFLWGAFNYLKSGGNKEEVAGARQMIIHAIIGFIILIFAFFIMQFIPQFFNLPGLDIIK